MFQCKTAARVLGVHARTVGRWLARMVVDGVVTVSRLRSPDGLLTGYRVVFRRRPQMFPPALPAKSSNEDLPKACGTQPAPVKLARTLRFASELPADEEAAWSWMAGCSLPLLRVLARARLPWVWADAARAWMHRKRPPARRRAPARRWGAAPCSASAFAAEARPGVLRW